MKITLSTITTGYNVSAINDNFTQIANALNNQVFYRDNPVGEANQLANNLDMNNNQILNPVIILPTSSAGLPLGAIYNDNGVIKVVT